jgi:hypothetical protein
MANVFSYVLSYFLRMDIFSFGSIIYYIFHFDVLSIIFFIKK